MKKTYIKPAVQVMNTGIEGAIMQIASRVDPAKTINSTSMDVNIDNKGGNDIDAKHYNAWETWDE